MLTAAHCIFVDNMTVVFGEHDRSKLEGTEQIRRIRKEEIFIHPDHFEIQDWGVQADYAILYFEKPVKFTKYVNPICLPENSLNNYESVEAKISGWGVLLERGEDQKGVISSMFDNPDILQKVQRKTI